MCKTLTFVLALAVTGAAAAQDRKVTTADFAGTWNIEVMSHQIALVIEPAEGNKITATMMMMGRDTLLKGELVEKTLTLVAVRSEVTGTMPPEHGTPGHDHDVPPAAAAGSGPKPILVTLQEDGTIAGEMMTTGGPVKWTGEKLRAKKKG
jgi:hypothetical protein